MKNRGSTYLCAWRVESGQVGRFTVSAKHPIEARQKAKRHLRDSIVPDSDGEFEVRKANLIERLQSFFGLLPDVKKAKPKADSPDYR